MCGGIDMNDSFLNDNVSKPQFTEKEKAAYLDEFFHDLPFFQSGSVDLTPYLNRGFEEDELEQISLALEDELPIEEWLTDDMYAQQILEIRLGLYERLDVSVYADVKYNWMQMKEIREGLEKNLDVSVYANNLFNHWQMKEIRLGLEAGLDVSSYAELMYSSTDMKKRRQALLEEQPARGAAIPKAKADSDTVRKKEFGISVEEDGNKVYAYIPWISGNSVTEEDILDNLSSRGIVYGVNREAIADMVNRRRLNEKILVAEGASAQKGNDGWYEFFVRTDLPRIPAPLPNGSVDYVNIEAFEMVEEGEKIAVYHPAEKGVDGKNVFGEEVFGENGHERNPIKGVGFQIEEDGITYTSKLNGKFEYVNGQIVITNMIVVYEDVTAVTGKMEVDGSVHVIGSVYSGGFIQATGDIIIEHNVETARLIAGGNIMVKKGACSKGDCFIEAGGEVSGSFFEAANINAGGNVKANYIMNSNISTMGKVIISGTKGMVLGGRVCAVKGLDVYNLGNSSHLRTIVEVGRNEIYEQEFQRLSEKRERILGELSVLEEGWNKVLKVHSSNKELLDESLQKLKESLQKLNAAIVAKDGELAELDAEISKLSSMTDADAKAPICVRGTAYEGSVVVINSTAYILPSDVSRVYFKMRNKSVVMVRM